MAAAQACGEQAVGYGTGCGEHLPWESAEQFGEPVLEVARGVQDGDRDTLRVAGESVAHEACGAQRVVVGPDRAFVVAHGVVGGH